VRALSLQVNYQRRGLSEAEEAGELEEGGHRDPRASLRYVTVHMASTRSALKSLIVASAKMFEHD